ncbi:MAG: hypothetical protein K6F94_09050 [Bacteroidaceae bacterium]|nr:hypothetical protein [Bacteroidaceae bacterium]
MSTHSAPTPFSMPMFRDFVPNWQRPWIYVMQAFCFQLGGAVYIGALNEMIGGRAIMREDVTMCLYSNLAGMAIWFPVLFRMKFRFSNRSLLIAAAVVLALCNWLFIQTTFMPLMWLLSFVAGIAKIQGTFENMSNIQLWLTPTRNMGVFFPCLHIILLTSIELQAWYSAFFAHEMHWYISYWLVIGLMLLVIAIQLFLTRPWCPMQPRVPLTGIDWLGAAFWSLLGLQIAYIFNYGDWLDWWHSSSIRILSGTSLITLGGCLHRMWTKEQPYFEPRMWTYRHLIPIILLIALVEGLLASEHVLEEIFYEEVMDYEMLTSRTLTLCALPGIWLGCLISFLWLKVWHLNVYKLIAIGMIAVALYASGFYFLVSENINIEVLRLPVAFRGFGYATLSIAFMWSLHEIMTFEHFFQSLSVFNFMHMYIGGVIGCALYSWGVRYYMADNIVRYTAYLDMPAYSSAPFNIEVWMDDFIQSVMAVTIKQLYGWVLYISGALSIAFLLWDMPAVRNVARRFPTWPIVGASILARRIIHNHSLHGYATPKK